jgi:hypothetical protein
VVQYHFFFTGTVTSLDPETFALFWTRSYPEASPLGHELRTAYPDRWLRIHNLPQSKRWPDTPGECQELLARQNTVATDLLGPSEPCWLIGYEYTGSATLPPDHAMASLLGSTPILSLPGEDPESPGTSLFGGEVEWLPGRFDSLLLAVAQDRLQALWVARDSGAVFAPYDGGADLIYPTEWQRDAARARYEPWLSAHPEGL